MASTPIFTSIALNFNANTVAGSGAVNRWVYTVPGGKRSQVRSLLVDIDDNANAINTTVAQIFAVIGGVTILVIRIQDDTIRVQPNNMMYTIELGSGDQLIGQSINNGAAGVIMRITASVAEYG